MQSNISTFILYSKHEPERAAQVAELVAQLPNTKIIAPVFPKYEHVPFIEKLVHKSKERTGKALLQNEIGCLLGHRRIWQEILKSHGSETEHYLVLESDSKLIDVSKIDSIYKMEQTPNARSFINQYDLFFWGAWNGHVSIKRSTRKIVDKSYRIGEPLIKSVYGTYGYSVNKKAARYLLAQTKKISFPVDFFKRYVNESVLKLGAVQNELVTTWRTTRSNINDETKFGIIKRDCIIKIFHCRNQIRAYFC